MVLNKEKIKKMSIILIFILAVIIRITKWPLTMAEINCDEAMTAINAKSIAETGCDIYGTKLPVYFESWLIGGQSILLTYLMAISIKLLGFSITAVRLPSLIISIVSLYIFDKLVQEIFGNKYEIRIITLLFLAINPWHIMQSVWALDCNLFPHIMLYAVYVFVRGINHNKKNLIYLSMVIFGVTLYSYGIALYVTPIFLSISLVYLLKKKKIKFLDIIISFLIFIAITWPIILMSIINLLGLQTVKIGFLTIQHFEHFERTSDMLIFSKNFIQTLINNVICTINLFIGNEDKLIWNALPKTGTIYLGTIVFAIISLVNFKTENEKEEQETSVSIIIIWLIVSIITGILINNVNINRLNTLWYPLIFFIGHGIYLVLKEFKFNKYLVGMFLSIYLICSVAFITRFYNLNYDMVYTWPNGLIKAYEEARDLAKQDVLYISKNTMNSDKKIVFLLYAINKESNNTEFLDKNIFLEYYNNDDLKTFETWLEVYNNVKVIDVENITDSMNNIIIKSNEWNDNFNNYNVKNYGKYIILQKEGE